MSRDYASRRSSPEWGLDLSQKNACLLERYRFEDSAPVLLAGTAGA
ncbi:MAG: hypothetical protein ACUVX9_09340 [Anaerolineae bacterium]